MILKIFLKNNISYTVGDTYIDNTLQIEVTITEIIFDKKQLYYDKIIDTQSYIVKCGEDIRIIVPKSEVITVINKLNTPNKHKVPTNKCSNNETFKIVVDKITPLEDNIQVH